MIVTRRRLIGSLAATPLLSGCDALDRSPAFNRLLNAGQELTFHGQRLVTDRAALAPEFAAADMSPVFRTNGTKRPTTDAYARLLADGFASWRLVVDGLVARPLALSLAELRAMPARTQITRHDCVEGWSAIGKWTGTPLKALLARAGLHQQARYVVFHCADELRGVPYYESVDMIDALHPQTILAWDMNDGPLDVGHGAPLRLRAERQLGYKQAKYVMRVEAVDSLMGIAGGKGGFWEDVGKYQWYAGI